MKVLHINCNYIGTALHQVMMNHFDDKSVEHYVFCPTDGYRESVIDPNDNVCVAECFKEIDKLWFGYKQKKIIDRIQSEYDVSTFDCIHAYTLFTDGNAAFELSKKFGVSYVLAVRSTDINAFLKWKPYLKYKALEIIRKAKAVFFLSKPYKELFLEKYVPKEERNEVVKKCLIIPNGIDNFWHDNSVQYGDLFSAQRIANREIRVVFVGRINKRKNIETIQKALNILRNRGVNVSFDFAGGIEDQKLFEKLLEYPNTIYSGKKNKEQLLEFYRNADVFVMPSYKETFGLVYAEAMSQGLPVIYSQGEGFDGQFEEGVVGYHVNSNDAVSVANGIEQIMENYKEICGNVVEASSRFGWTNIVHKYQEIYHDIECSKRK